MCMYVLLVAVYGGATERQQLQPAAGATGGASVNGANQHQPSPALSPQPSTVQQQQQQQQCNRL